MSLTENSNHFFSSWGLQQARKIAHIYQVCSLTEIQGYRNIAENIAIKGQQLFYS